MDTFRELRFYGLVNSDSCALLSKHTESGVRMFSNDIVGETVYIDKASLENSTTCQEIEFDMLDGYYIN